MTPSTMAAIALVGTAVQFGVIYGAIRLALFHDRTVDERAAKREAAEQARTTTRPAA